MAIKYYSSIDLRTNQLQNALIHVAGSAPTSPSPAQGQIYYNSGNDTVYTYDGSSWNDLTSNFILEDDDGTEVSISNAEEIKFIGSGITTNWTDVSDGSDSDPFDLTFTVDADQTGITSIKNNSLIIGGNSQNNTIDFGTDDVILFDTDNSERMRVDAAGVDITGDLTVSGSYNLASGDIPNNAADTSGTAAIATTVTVADESSDTTCFPTFVTAATGNLGPKSGTNLTFNSSSGVLTATGFAGNITGDITGDVTGDVTGDLTGDVTGNVTGDVTGDLTGDLTIGGHKVDDIDIASETSNADDHLMTALAIKNKIEEYSYITASSSDTLTNKTIAASQVTEISNLTASEGEQIENIGGTNISATQWEYLGAASGAITNTDIDVSVGNLEARLPQIDTATTIGNGVTITAGGDFTVTGDLIVSGDVTTVNTATITVEDPLIKLASGNNAADTVDIGLFGLYDTSGSQDLYGGLFRDANDSGKWKLFKDSQTDPGTGTTIDTSATGYAVATLVADLEGGVTGNVTGDASGSAATVTGAAQTAITSLGTLTALTVDNVSIDGTTIGHTSDTDLITLADSVVTVAGELSVTTLDIGGTNVTSTATELNLLDGITTLSGSNTGDESTSSTSTAGVVELATSAETITGTDSGRAVTPDGLAARTVVSTIDVSAMTTAGNNYAEITHSLGTEDVIVQLFDATTKDTVHADVLRTDKSGSASTNKIKVLFAKDPTVDIEVIITSFGGATAVSPAYS